MALPSPSDPLPGRSADEPDPQPESVSTLSPERLVPNRRVPAWLLSVLLHSSLFGLMVWLLATMPNGAGEVENRTGGIVLVDLESETTEYLSEGEVEESVEAQTPMTAASAANPTIPELPPELPGIESTTQPSDGVAESVVDNLPGADSLIVPPKTGGQVGGQVTTDVFGVKGTGSRFVYVFDRSQSMGGFGGKPILAARTELIDSLSSLDPNSEFQIIFYNDGVRIFNPDGMRSLVRADDDTLRKARSFVLSVQPSGGTDHLNALKAAFQFGPDVIFFLTDAEGGFTASELMELGRTNRSGAVINAIEFGERQGRDQSLKAVTETSGGQYIFKNVRTLRVN